MSHEPRDGAGTEELGTAYGRLVGAGLLEAVKEDIRLALSYYSRCQAKRIFKRFGLLAECLGRLRRDFNLPAVRLSDLRQMFPVVLAPVLSDEEKVALVCRLYSEIARHPQWTTRGNIAWVERQLLNAISRKAARKAASDNGTEPLAVRKAA